MMRFLWSFSPAPPFYYQDLWGSPQNVQPVTHKRIRSHRLKGIQTRWKELSQNITFILFAGSYYQISHNKKLLTDRQKHIHARSKSRPTPMIFPKIDCCVEYHIECCALVFKISHMRKWARWVRNGSWLPPPPEGFLIKHHVFHRSGAVAALNFCSSYRRLSRSACYSSQSNAHKNDLKESEAAQPECGELRWQAGIWFSCATGGNKFFQRNSDTLIHHIAKTVYLEWSIPRDITYITATACWSSLKESLLLLLDILLLLLDNTTISIPHRNQLYLEEHRAVLVWVRRLNIVRCAGVSATRGTHDATFPRLPLQTSCQAAAACAELLRLLKSRVLQDALREGSSEAALTGTAGNTFTWTRKQKSPILWVKSQKRIEIFLEMFYFQI